MLNRKHTPSRSIRWNPFRRSSTSRYTREYHYSADEKTRSFRNRSRFMMTMLYLFVLVLFVGMFRLWHDRDFLVNQGTKRIEQQITLTASRGTITDRNGVVLATNVPAVAVWVDPLNFKKAKPEQAAQLAQLLDIPMSELEAKTQGSRRFVYLKQHVTVAVEKQIKALKVPGINFESNPIRVYPQGALFANVIGLTDTDDNGISGVEKFFNRTLSGTPGYKDVLHDRYNHVIQDLKNTVQPINGDDVHLTINANMQFVAAQALESAIKKHEAKSGAAIVVDVKTGQILAMVSLPSFDPKTERGDLMGHRNRVVTDTFEPGSIMKPIVAALALDSQAITMKTVFETGNGVYTYYGRRITDVERNGDLTVAGVIRRSSNIGMTLISQRMSSQQIWTLFRAVGFGQTPQLAFPGAASGILHNWKTWGPVEKATVSYGYGVSVSLLQIAQAYTALARHGDMIRLSLVQHPGEHPQTLQVYSPQVAKEIRGMLAAAVGPDGNRVQRFVSDYSVGGKSGTARQLVGKTYSQKLYRSSFVMMAPINNPRIIVAVTVEEPHKGGYYGAVVAAPVAAAITENVLRRMGVAPDRLPYGQPIYEASTSQHSENRTR